MEHHGIDFPEVALAALCRAHGIRRCSLFGSVLRDDFGPDSDIDVLVEFEPGARVGLSFFEIQDELSELLGRAVDLHTPSFLGKYFRETVVASAEPLYDAAA